MSDQEHRIEALESRLAYQDQALQELSQELFAQQRQIEQLQASCRELARRLTESSSGLADSVGDERPPHY